MQCASCVLLMHFFAVPSASIAPCFLVFASGDKHEHAADVAAFFVACEFLADGFKFGCHLLCRFLFAWRWRVLCRSTVFIIQAYIQTSRQIAIFFEKKL
mgnify:CR=1 FL=1